MSCFTSKNEMENVAYKDSKKDSTWLVEAPTDLDGIKIFILNDSHQPNVIY